MKEINLKIQELLILSATKVDYKNGWNELNKKMNAQDVLIDEIKSMSKANNILLGRLINFPMADSYASYIITKVNKVTVELTWLDYCDAWIDDRCGKLCLIDYNYAKEYVEGHDRIEKIFPPRKLITENTL